MNLEQLRRLLAQHEGRLSELTSELEGMPDEPTDDHRSRAADIHTILREAHEESAERGLLDEIDHVRAQIALVERAHQSLERGGSEPGEDRGAPNANTRTSDDPFDLTTLRTSPMVDGPERHAAELRGRARAAIERAEFPADIGQTVDEQREHVTRLLERIDPTEDMEAGAFSRHLLVTGSAAYERAYGRALRGRPLTSEDQQVLSRAMTIGTGSEGGHAVMPFTLDPTVMLSSDGSVNPIRRIARVETGVTNQWKGVSSAGMTASYAAEAAEAGDDSPALDDPTVTAHRAQAFVPFSIELDQDWAQLRSTITVMVNEARDDLEAEKFVTGTGTGQPQGILTGLGNDQRVLTATAETFASEDVYAVEVALPPRFRSRAQWIGEKAIYSDVRQFASADGHDLWERIGAGQPGLLLGYPANEASGMPADSTEAGDSILVLGDWARYLVYDRVGLALELIPHLFGANRRPTGQRGLYAFWRNGAGLLVANAFRHLEVQAT